MDLAAKAASGATEGMGFNVASRLAATGASPRRPGVTSSAMDGGNHRQQHGFLSICPLASDRLPAHLPLFLRLPIDALKNIQWFD
ncbi:UNVERIFIED_ORG: hypothetical protein J2W85_005414 [Ensifer adhaerens]|nr:hypothetical protein [Ensifer adhaerens]